MVSYWIYFSTSFTIGFIPSASLMKYNRRDISRHQGPRWSLIVLFLEGVGLLLVFS